LLVAFFAGIFILPRAVRWHLRRYGSYFMGRPARNLMLVVRDLTKGGRVA
jgi:hypothetical protein